MVKPIPHGTAHCYNLGCRCARCREANTARARARRAYLRTQRLFVNGRWVSPFAEHGTLNGYGNWQCRCDLCTSVHAANCERLRLARVARQKTALR